MKDCVKLVISKGIAARKVVVKETAVDLLCEIYEYIPDTAY